MSRVILHSDDLGLHPAVSSAILELGRIGALKSTSVLANGIDAEQALASARGISGLGVGVHLNIVRGRPLSPHNEVDSLLDHNGRFLNSPAKLCLRSLAKQLNPQHIYAEYRRQIERVLQAGITPTHLDSEKHSHLWLPQCAPVIAKLCKEFSITRVRTINELQLLRRLELQPPLKQRLKLKVLEHGSKRLQRRAPALKSAAYTFGVAVSGAVDYDNYVRVMKSILECDAGAAVEWIFHVGYSDELGSREFVDAFCQFRLHESRKREEDFLKSGAVTQLLAAHTGKLINYGGL